jgi:hypothetical protein
MAQLSLLHLDIYGQPNPEKIPVDKLEFTQREYTSVPVVIKHAQKRIHDRFRNISTLFANRGNQSTLRFFNFLLEEYLYLLTFTPTIAELTLDKLSPHYIKYKSVSSEPIKLLSDDLIQSFVYLNNKVWLGGYGSLVYELALLGRTYRYIQPSELSYKSVISVLESKMSKYPKLIGDILSHSNNITEQGDRGLYTVITELISYLPINKLADILEILNSWLTGVFEWYLANKDLIINNKKLTPNQQFLADTVKLVSKYGLDVENFSTDRVKGRLLHQSIGITEYELYEEIISLKNTYSGVVNIDYSITDEEQTLIMYLFDKLPRSIEPYFFRRQSEEYLMDFFPPGGYNTLLVLIASLLINRAYSLSHESRTQFSSLLFYGVSDIVVYEDLKARLIKLILMAADLLKSTNLATFQAFGKNLRVIVGFRG